MNVVIISQARMTSTRLPGKVLKEVLDKPLLQYQMERLRRVKNASQVVVATTTNDTDEPIVRLMEALGCAYFRGSENDVLSRYYGAAKAHNADVVVRVTSDCPIIDPLVIERVIDFYLSNQSSYEYVSNTLERTYPRGMDTEVFSFRGLEEAYQRGHLEYEREHVTPYFYTHPERFQLGNVAYDIDASSHRWTVDTPEDFELISRMITELYPTQPRFTLEDALQLLHEHPDWSRINAHVEQKKLGQ